VDCTELIRKLLDGFAAGTRFENNGRVWVRRYFAGRLRGATSEDGRWQIIEQNPQKNSEWAHLARSGRQVFQMLDLSKPGRWGRPGQYYGVVVDGVLRRYTGMRGAA